MPLDNILNNHFDPKSREHLNFISEKTSAFKALVVRVHALNTTEARAVIGAIGGYAAAWTSLPFIASCGGLTLLIAVACGGYMLSTWWKAHVQFAQQLQELKEVYSWVMKDDTVPVRNKLGYTEFQNLILTLGPWVDEGFAWGWDEKDLQESSSVATYVASYIPVFFSPVPADRTDIDGKILGSLKDLINGKAEKQSAWALTAGAWDATWITAQIDRMTANIESNLPETMTAAAVKKVI
ncbi:hypothetical protein ACFORL_04070 [Legionella dresdenensis]|uniref:Phosphatase n=1 Tax=Legionella dresdenensis TaxID=450200 RepID=A0ABV8CE54_9GAMM